MDNCPACGQPLVPFRAKLVCRTPGCGFMESCCDGGWMQRSSEKRCQQANESNSVESHGTETSRLSDPGPAG
jgi:transcription initiation factor TFIIIB Brf1 subunit/transcription initiation factor TFIIB